MKRLSAIISALIISLYGYSNMASPEQDITTTSEAYSSKHIDILSESLNITLIDIYTAKFTVVYTVKTDRQGRQIPLIFDTMTDRYSDNSDFNVWVDNVEIAVSKIPSTYENPKALQWVDSLDTQMNYPKSDVPNIIGLKYFEVDLSKGIHTIRVEYTALAGSDSWGAVKKYYFNYNLKPAKYWKSFGDLNISVDVSKVDGVAYTVNLSETDSILTAPVSNWHFTELPQDEIRINLQPPISKFAKLMAAIGPEILSLFFLIILVVLHVYLVFKYRKANPDKRYSKVVIIGSFIVTALYYLSYLLSDTIVNSAIGEHAANRGNVYMLLFFLFMYPVFTFVYWGIMHVFDRFVIPKIKSR